MKVTKLFQTTPASVDDVNKSVTFKISDNQPDRMGEVVDQASWDFKEYQSNPIVLWGHDPEKAENVLGTADTLSISPDGSHTDAVLNFATDINPKAQMVFDMIKRGILRTVSVGFLNGETEYKDGTPILRNNKLLEISVVPIPANPRAIALAYKAGGLSTKDAKWLVDSMKSEADVIEKQLNESEDSLKEKAMTDEQFKEVMEAVSNLSKTVSDNQAANDEKLSSLTEQLTTLKPADDEAANDADKEEAKNEDAEDASAKDGSDDQSGADDIDLDAELTPELEAQLEADLAAVAA